MTRWCTARPSGRHAHGAGRARREDGRSRAAAAFRRRPGSCTARTPGGAAHLSTRRLRFWGTRSAPAGPRTRTGRRSRPFCPRSARRHSRRWVSGSAPCGSTCVPGTILVSSPNGLKPDRGGLDDLLRPALLVGTVSLPTTRQHLPDALGAEEIQEAGAPTSASAPGGPGFSSEIPDCSGTGPGRDSSAGKGEKSRNDGRLSRTESGGGSPGLRCPGPPDPLRFLIRGFAGVVRRVAARKHSLRVIMCSRQRTHDRHGGRDGQLAGRCR